MPTYPLTGTADAELEARLGNFRLAQTRLGFLNPLVRITINGVEVTTAVEKGTVRITQNLTGPWTSTLIVRDSVTPIEGQEVQIAIGTITNLLFGGHITEVRQIHGELASLRKYSISCTDYQWLFDRRRVMRTYDSDNIESIAHDLLSTFATGFTGEHIEQSLGFLTGGRSFTMETMTGAFKRLAQEGNAYFYIDPYKDVHLVATDRVPQPHDLSSSYTDFEAVSYAVDLSQIKTRVYVEGAGNQLSDQYNGSGTMVLDDWERFPGTAFEFDVRIGEYAPMGSRRFRWWRGAITNTLEKPSAYADYNYDDYVAMLPFPVGTPVNIWLLCEDTAAQTALAALEGGDGIHEDYVQDRRLSYSGCLERGTAELARYASPIERLSYKTRDPNTRPGGQVTVNLPTQGITGTFTIQSVTIDAFEEATNKHPWKTVTAAASDKTLWDIYQAALDAPSRNTI